VKSGDDDDDDDIENINLFRFLFLRISEETRGVSSEDDGRRILVAWINDYEFRGDKLKIKLKKKTND
jgi:hypothetical protein